MLILQQRHHLKKLVLIDLEEKLLDYEKLVFVAEQTCVLENLPNVIWLEIIVQQI
jgi:hypothetical protein